MSDEGASTATLAPDRIAGDPGPDEPGSWRPPPSGAGIDPGRGDVGDTPGAGGRTVHIPDIPYRRLLGFAMVGIAGLLALFLVYLVAFTPLTASRDQQRLADSLKGQPLTVYRLVNGHLPPEGSAVGVLTIPSIGVDQVVVAGTSAADLMNGPGLMPGSSLPGSPGNSVIAGRRVTFGAPFGSIGSLRTGAKIDVVDGAGSFIYKVTRVRIVAIGQKDVVLPTADNRITLVTSNSSLVTSGRLVVQGKLVGHAVAVPDRHDRRPELRPRSERGPGGRWPGADVVVPDHRRPGRRRLRRLAPAPAVADLPVRGAGHRHVRAVRLRERGPRPSCHVLTVVTGRPVRLRPCGCTGTPCRRRACPPDGPVRLPYAWSARCPGGGASRPQARAPHGVGPGPTPSVTKGSSCPYLSVTLGLPRFRTVATEGSRGAIRHSLRIFEHPSTTMRRHFMFRSLFTRRGGVALAAAAIGAASLSLAFAGTAGATAYPDNPGTASSLIGSGSQTSYDDDDGADRPVQRLPRL